MKADEFCIKAAKHLTGDRRSTHGDMEEGFFLISNLWSHYLMSAKNAEVDVDPSDVANMMILLKVARSVVGKYNEDDYIDMAGYAGIAGFLASEGDD